MVGRMWNWLRGCYKWLTRCGISSDDISNGWEDVALALRMSQVVERMWH